MLPQVPNLSMQDLVNIAGPLPGPAPQLVRNRGASNPTATGHTAAGSQFQQASARAPDTLEVLSPAKLREAQSYLIQQMLGGMDLVRAVRSTVQVRGPTRGKLRSNVVRPCLHL